MTRPRCGNDPRAQLTAGDHAAVANFRAYLAARAEEKTTVTDLDKARAALQPYEIVSGFTGHLEAFEAAVRANERAAAETRRLGAPDAVPTPSAAIRRKLRRWAYSAGYIESELDGAADGMYAAIARDIAGQQPTDDLLRRTESYLSALHGSVARHDNLGANLGCAGCELRDQLAAEQRRLAEAQETDASAETTDDEGTYAQPDPPINCLLPTEERPS